MDKKSFILPTLLILLIGSFCMGFWGEWDFYIVNDHPLRIQYIWDTLTINLPIFHKLIYWNPFINCGEPSLSLYPPGFVIFGAGINFITFHKLPLEIIYKFLLIFAYFLPGFSSLLLYKKIGVSRISALFGALIMMLYSNITIGGDVEGGMVIGLLGMRLAIGLAPLILYFGICCLEDRHKLKNAILTGLMLGLSILTHTWDSLFPLCGIIFLFIFNIRLLSLKKVIWLLLFILIFAMCICAFWVLPAFIHREFLRRAFLWDFSINEVYSWIKVLTPFILLYLISIVGIPNIASNTQVKKITPLTFLPPLMLIFIFLSYFLLFKIFGIELFEPARLKDNFFFSILILSGVGIECIWGHTLNMEFTRKFYIQGVSLICLIIILILPFMNLPSKSSYTSGSIAYYNNYSKQYHLDDIWRLLKSSPDGRILFTSSSRPMKGAYHTHIFALTPVFIGREIIGGVPTTHTPVANYLYYGGKQDKNTDFAEVFDNKSIFGMSYDEDIDAKRLHELCKQLNITTIVVGKYEDKVLSFFKSQPKYFPLRTKIDRFHIFDVAEYQACLLDYNKNKLNACVIKSKMDEINIKVFEAKQKTQLIVKISYYPLWKAYLNNRLLKITQDKIGLVKIEVPEGKDYIIKLKYEDGLVEQLGWIITLLALVSIPILLLVNMVYCKMQNVIKT
ncbi:MAG: hypothetical protein AB1567_08655 [bacterium]